MNRAVLGLPIVAMLVGCLASRPAENPTPPAIPQGWATVVQSGLRMALPSQWPLAEGWDGLVVDMGVGDPNVFLLALAPVDVAPQPESDVSTEELTDWIVDRISSSRPDRYSRSERHLPAGPAVMVRFHFDGEMGQFEAVEGVAYAIRTREGVAYLQINMSESVLDEFEAAMAEVPLHLSLADPSP